MPGKDELDRVQTEDNETSNRRNFLQMAAGTGLAGIAAGSPLLAQSAGAAPQNAASDPPSPVGLRPGASPDGRFPEMYENSVPEATKVLMRYFGSLAGRNRDRLASVFHFPFASYEGTEPVVVESQQELIARAPASVNLSVHPERFTDHDGFVKEGSYDLLDSMEMLTADPVSVNFALEYSRYGTDGKKLLKCEGIYAITNNDGKWGIQVMSTIFTPANLEHISYPDVIDTVKRLRAVHGNAYQVSDPSEVWNPVRQYGRIATIAQPRDAKGMDAYRAKGVKSRLQVADVTPESVAKAIVDFPKYRESFGELGLGNWGFTFGFLPDTRVLHASVNKAHLLAGVSRYNVFGEEVSTATELSIMTYKKGRWGWLPGSFGRVTNHDRTNNLRA